MKTALQWKVLLPIVQSVLAIALWLCTPVQYRRELLQLAHKPADHPYRVRLEPPKLFPPTCEQVLDVLSFPAFAASLAIVDPLLYRIEYSRQAGLPGFVFTLPVGDPEALPPRTIRYSVHVQDLGFLGLVVLLWCWVGWRVDEFIRKRKGAYTRRPRALRVLELVFLAASVPSLVGFACWYISVAASPHAQRIGILGLIWPAVLLVYTWRAVRQEIKHTDC